MKARPPKPGSGDVRGLMAELSDLIDDLGLHHIDAPVPPEAPATPDEQPAATADVLPLAAPPPPSAPVWRSGPEVLTGSAASSLDTHMPVPVREPVDAGPPAEAVDAVPMWETADEDTAAAGLWEAFAPEL